MSNNVCNVGLRLRLTRPTVTALGQSDQDGEGTVFVAFMLQAIKIALVDALNDDGVNDGVNLKLDALGQQPSRVGRVFCPPFWS